jgi:hypothetical protein
VTEPTDPIETPTADERERLRQEDEEHAAKVAAAREYFSDDAAGQARWEAAVNAMFTRQENAP